MTVSFKIDTVTMPLDPYRVEPEPKEVIDRAHSGKPVRDAYRTFRLFFDDMTTANFTTLIGYDDGAAHTLTIPHPVTGVYTNYAGAYFRLARAPVFEDITVSDVEFEASWIVA